jgi:magnesium chelatase subunit I
VARTIIGHAVRKVFDRRFPVVGKEVGSGGEDDDGPYAAIVRWFAEGNGVTLSDEAPFAEHLAELTRVPGLLDLARDCGAGTPREQAFWAEIALEGLHQHLKLARQDLDSQISYKEMVKFQLLKPRSHRQGDGRS